MLTINCPVCKRIIDVDDTMLITGSASIECPQCNQMLKVELRVTKIQSDILRDAHEADTPFEKAVELISHCDAITMGMLKHYLNLNHSEASVIMQQLEDQNYVGPYELGCPHTILVPHDGTITVAAFEKEFYD